MLRLIVCVGLMLGAAMADTQKSKGYATKTEVRKVEEVPEINIDIGDYDLVRKKIIYIPMKDHYSRFYLKDEYIVSNGKYFYIFDSIHLNFKQKVKAHSIDHIYNDTVFNTGNNYIYKVDIKNGSREKYINLSHLNLKPIGYTGDKRHIYFVIGSGKMLVISTEEEDALHRAYAFDLESKKLIWSKYSDRHFVYSYNHYLFRHDCQGIMNYCYYYAWDIRNGEGFSEEMAEKIANNGAYGEIEKLLKKYGIFKNELCQIVGKDEQETYLSAVACQRGDILSLYNYTKKIECKKDIFCQGISIYRRKK